MTSEQKGQRNPRPPPTGHVSRAGGPMCRHRRPLQRPLRLLLLLLGAVLVLKRCSAQCDAGPQVQYSTTTCGSISEGNNCNYQCPSGYWGSASVNPHTCSSGTLSGGVCIVLSCPYGNRITNSDTVCSGSTGDTCEYTCQSGYVAGGTHTCASARTFTGGSCDAADCSTGLTIAGSDSTCSGAAGAVCSYTCRAGYTKGGTHMCRTYGAFYGGYCTAAACNAGLTIDNSDTTCGGYTDDQCTFSCQAGYVVTGTHTCRYTGSFTGGTCVAQPCTSGLTISGYTGTCSGSTGDVCSYTCRAGFDQGGTHTCGTDQVFSGGACTAQPCTSGFTLANSDTTCSGATEDECSYTCQAGCKKIRNLP